MSNAKMIVAGVSALLLTATAQASPVAGQHDSELSAEVTTLIEKTPALQADGLRVEVVNGVAYVRGEVANSLESREAAEIAARAPGVVSVVDETSTSY